MGKLADSLAANGFTEAEIEKIFYQNALRVIRDVLRCSPQSYKIARISHKLHPGEAADKS